MRRSALLLLLILTLWLIGGGTAILPIPFGGTLLSLGVSVLVWVSIIVLSVAAGWALGRRWIAAVAGLGSLALCVTCLNWVAVAPESWFDVHRAQYEAAARSRPNPDPFYGERLPLHFMWLTVDGHVSSPDPGVLFFPQWAGIPDDAGGYFYSPMRSPDGFDMYGMLCEDPVDLGGHWFMCGM